MNWEALGAAGEFVGAAAVVVSLIFLIREMRSNTTAIRSAAYANVAEETTDLLSTWYADERLPLLLSRVIRGAGIDEFEDEDQVRLTLAFLALVYTWQQGYQQALRDGVVDPYVLAGMKGVFAQTTFFREFWREHRPLVAPDFADFIERELDLRGGSAQ